MTDYDAPSSPLHRGEKTVSYGITVKRSLVEPNWVDVGLRKHFWAVGTGSRSREVARSGFWATDMSERAILEAALTELLRAYRDEMG